VAAKSVLSGRGQFLSGNRRNLAKTRLLALFDEKPKIKNLLEGANRGLGTEPLAARD